GWDDVRVHACRGMALEKLGRAAAADAAFQQAWARDPNHPDMLLGYGFAVCERLPKEAQAAFLKVIERQPLNVRALYGCAMLMIRQQRDSPEALPFLDLVLRVNPLFVDARQ